MSPIVPRLVAATRVSLRLRHGHARLITVAALGLEP